MSRIGKKPVPVPAGVTFTIKPGVLELKGPQGTLSQPIPPLASVEHDKQSNAFVVTRSNDTKQARAQHGLTRALVANAVEGVLKGYEKSLDVIGTGYNAKLKGKHLELQVGFFLPQARPIPDGLQVTLPNPTKIIVRGCSKHLVGQFAASVRLIRPPDKYQGKGVRYSDEVVKLKERKAAGSGGK